MKINSISNTQVIHASTNTTVVASSSQTDQTMIQIFPQTVPALHYSLPEKINHPIAKELLKYFPNALITIIIKYDPTILWSYPSYLLREMRQIFIGEKNCILNKESSVYKQRTVGFHRLTVDIDRITTVLDDYQKKQEAHQKALTIYQKALEEHQIVSEADQKMLETHRHKGDKEEDEAHQQVRDAHQQLEITRQQMDFEIEEIREFFNDLSFMRFFYVLIKSHQELKSQVFDFIIRTETQVPHWKNSCFPAKLKEHTKITRDEFWKHFSIWSQFQTVDLSKAGFMYLTEEIVAILAQMQLKALNLSNNRLIAVPPSIHTLKQLETLDLSDNRISAIPEEMSNLEHLRVLNVRNNKLPAIPKIHRPDRALCIIADGNCLTDQALMELNKLNTFPKSMCFASPATSR